MTINDRRPRASFRLLLALPIAALAFSLAACGGPSRPSADDVADGFQEVFEGTAQEEVMTDEVSLCFAEALVDSDLSNETLTYIANGEDKQKNQEEKDLTTQIIQEKQADCIPQ
ncbi:hypothetical protein [Microbacterium sp. 179-I 3D3 NHS]|uniref:hypothetical protein n=1 Tax=unclassified Microbacterium TaxID=2609290 RepID=UPI0039A035E6